MIHFSDSHSQANMGFNLVWKVWEVLINNNSQYLQPITESMYQATYEALSMSYLM